MDAAVKTEASASPGLVWTGRTISGLVVLFLIGGSLFGIIKAAELAPQFAHTGYPMSLQLKIPIVCILCAIIYAIPQTAVLGAQVAAAADQISGSQPQCCGSAVDHVPCAFAQQLVATDAVVRTQPQP